MPHGMQRDGRPTQGTHTGDPHRGPTQRGGPHRGPTTGGEGHTGDPHRTHTDTLGSSKARVRVNPSTNETGATNCYVQKTYGGVFLLLQQRSKHLREMAITPKASTSHFSYCFGLIHLAI